MGEDVQVHHLCEASPEQVSFDRCIVKQTLDETDPSLFSHIGCVMLTNLNLHASLCKVPIIILIF